MRIFKKALIFLLCICSFSITLSFPQLKAFAASGPTIKVSTTTAVPLDTVIINIDMVENTGVMAMTFTIAYNPDVLSYSDYYFGVFNDYTVVDHPELGYISFINCESSTKLYTGSILALEFNVKSSAPPGFHEIKIRHIHPETNGDSMTGCFANWKGDKIVPTIINGGITIGETCNNMGHTYDEWKTILESQCEDEGIKTRSCTACGHNETAAIPAVGHIYQDFWTVDREATAEKKGVMSRHCINCDKVTDKIYFSISESEENNFSNSYEGRIDADSWDKLQQIIDIDSGISSSTTEAPETENPPEKSDTETSPLPEETEVLIPDNALELVDNTKKQSDGLINKIYKYFFGTDNNGVLSIIKTAAPPVIKKLKPIFFILPMIFLSFLVF